MTVTIVVILTLRLSSGTFLTALGGLQYGADLRWNTPLKGLLVGVSRVNEDITGTGASDSFLISARRRSALHESSNADWINQFYGEYVIGRLRLDSEYRRYVRDKSV